MIGDARVVDDGQIVTAGGVTACLDLGLWLVQRIRGPAAAAARAAQLEYTRTGYVWRRPAVGCWLRLEFPQTQLAKGGRRAGTRAAVPDFMYNHSVRSYLFARVAAAARGLAAGEDYDDELLFLSCILHDVGLAAQADRGRRFEVDWRRGRRGPAHGPTAWRRPERSSSGTRSPCTPRPGSPSTGETRSRSPAPGSEPTSAATQSWCPVNWPTGCMRGTRAWTWPGA